MRDTAIGGLACLLNRSDWRQADNGSSIAAVVSNALDDSNPVVRMQAAYAARALHADASAGERAAAVGELFLAEEDSNVKSVLLNQLVMDAVAASEVVDRILQRLLANDGSMPVGGDEVFGRVLIGLMTYLAVGPQTTFVTRLVSSWCGHAPRHAGRVEGFTQCAREYLAPGHDFQQNAFRLLATAAEASAALWDSCRELDQASGKGDESRRRELEGAAQVAYGITRELYFASGAYEEEQGRGRYGVEALHVFADLAFPVLSTSVRVDVPQCIHEAVQTMVFLAPLDEGRALRCIAAAVPDRGPYLGDPIAGGVVVPYLHRLLAEERHLVLFDAVGNESFRDLLAKFAEAGSQGALELAYNFADVFR